MAASHFTGDFKSHLAGWAKGPTALKLIFLDAQLVQVTCGICKKIWSAHEFLRKSTFKSWENFKPLLLCFTWVNQPIAITVRTSMKWTFTPCQNERSILIGSDRPKAVLIGPFLGQDVSGQVLQKETHIKEHGWDLWLKSVRKQLKRLFFFDRKDKHILLHISAK